MSYSSGLSCTPKMVQTTSRGIHPKWSAPRGVIHTTSHDVHPKWSTPRDVVHTINFSKVESAQGGCIYQIHIYNLCDRGRPLIIAG